MSKAVIQSLHRQLRSSEDPMRAQRLLVEQLNAHVQAQHQALERMQQLLDDSCPRRRRAAGAE